MYTTLSFRIKDSASRKRLDAMANSVNFVWNYCNETSYSFLKNKDKWLSNFDLQKLTAGCTKALGVGASTVDAVCDMYVIRRRAARKNKLRWRTGKSLGWVPFKSRVISKMDGQSFVFLGHRYKIWGTRDVGEIKCGSFSRDVRRRWYVNFVCKVEEINLEKTGFELGVDLGLKTTAAYSNGELFTGIKATQKHAERLAKAQRATKRLQAAKVYSKIKNTRGDAQHKESLKLVTKYDLIAVGDVSSAKLMKTKMAKSVSDNAWYAFKTMLAYKAIRFGKVVKIVDERYSTVLCSVCSAKTGPAGLRQLGVRAWKCSSCGASHDRDTNAAKNILARYKALYPNQGSPAREGADSPKVKDAFGALKHPYEQDRPASFKEDSPCRAIMGYSRRFTHLPG